MWTSSTVRRRRVLCFDLGLSGRTGRTGRTGRATLFDRTPPAKIPDLRFGESELLEDFVGVLGKFRRTHRKLAAGAAQREWTRLSLSGDPTR